MGPDELKAKGNNEFKHQRFREAINYYGQAIEKDPKNAVCYSNRAACFLKVDEFASALKDCVAGLALDEGQLIKGKLFYRKHLSLKGLGRLREARVALESASQCIPTDKSIKRELQDLDRALSSGESTGNAKTGGSKGLIKIDITRVDDLPPEFTLKKSTSKVQMTERSTSPVAPAPAPAPAALPEHATQNWRRFASLIRQNRLGTETTAEAEATLQELLSIPAERFHRIFNLESRSGITAEFMNYVLDLFIKAGKETQRDEFLNLFKLFSTCRRFDLSKTTINHDKVSEVESILHDNTLHELFRF